ncbi:MAG TPA: hypothetical protein VG892_07795 [Terriglobales bacterium]|nr:hypothetical protein [Terriglobales bacterium]
MSYSGLTTDQLTPEMLQQMEQYRQKMAAAQALMGNNANPQTPYAGISNAGSSLLGAMAMKRIQDQNDPLGHVNVTPAVNSSWMQRLFSLGGG